MVAAWLGRRYGRFVPIVAAMVINVIAVYFMVHSNSGSVFVATLGTATFCLFFVYPYLLGAAAEIDPLGGCRPRLVELLFLLGARAGIWKPAYRLVWWVPGDCLGLTGLLDCSARAVG